ncbi:MAG: hypothetical protein M1281_08450 [Chloroflexi bacterium]|nr:hypothetical protein [Chloroflexota bacterium]
MALPDKSRRSSAPEYDKEVFLNTIDQPLKKSTPIKRWIALLAALLILLAAFTLLDFRLSKSSSTVNSEVASSRQGDALPFGSFNPAATGLYVEGGGSLARMVQNHLTGLLQNQSPVGRVTAINAPVDRMDIPVLYVEIKPVQHFYTPFYTRSEYELEVSYASNGDISFRTQAVTHFQSSNGEPALQYKAHFSLTDTTYGLISYPAYQKSLADLLEVQIRDNHQKQMADWQSSP